MSHRTYSWNKSDLKPSSYSSGSSNSNSNSASKPTETVSKKYESSYSRTKAEAPPPKDTNTRTSLSALDKIGSSPRYSSTGSSSYKSSYSPSASGYSRDKSGTREKESNALGGRYGSYTSEDKPEKTSVLNKYMSGRAAEKSTDTTSYNRLTVNSAQRSRSREASPVEKNRYAYTRSITSVQPKTLDSIADSKSKSVAGSKEKLNDSSTDKDKSRSSGLGMSSYSSYKLYSRPLSYSRPILKDDTKVEPLTSRYGSRYSSSYTRPSPLSPPPAPVEKEVPKSPIVQNGTNHHSVEEKPDKKDESDGDDESSESEDDSNHSMVDVTVVTRGTSPTAPCSSVYLRTRRADMAKTIEKTISRPKKKVKMVDKEMQSDRMDDSTRSCRYASMARVSTSPWSSYSDTRYTGSSSASRYSSGLSTGRYYNYSSTKDDKSTSRTPRLSESESEKPTETVTPKPMDSSYSIARPSSRSEVSSIYSTNSSRLPETRSAEISKSSIPRHSPVEILTKVNENIASSDRLEENVARVSPRRSIPREKSKSTSPPVAVPDSPVAKQSSPEMTSMTNQLPPQVPKTDSQPLTKSSSSTSTVSKTGKKTVKKVVKKIKTTVKKSSSNTSADNDSNGPESPSVENSCESPKPLMKLKSQSSLIKPKSVSVSRSEKSKSKTPSRSSSGTESNLTMSSSSSDEDEKEKDDLKPIANGIKQNRSATSFLASSADDASLSYDNFTKPPLTPRTPKSDNQPRTEEAKSFLMRALAPVASLFKMQYQNSDEKGHWLDSTGESEQNTSNNAQSLATDSDQKYKINVRRMESGTRDWWLDSNSEKSGENHLNSNNRSVGKSDGSEPKDISGNGFKLKVADSGERAWWLQSNANIPEGVEVLPPSRKGSSDSDKSEKFDVYKIRQVDSSDKETRVADDSVKSNHKTKATNGDDNFILNVVRIRHIESGEKAWWLSSQKNIPDGVHCSSTSSDSSDSEELVHRVNHLADSSVVTGKYSVPVVVADDDEESLGDRKSPEGLETPQTEEGRTAYGYDNFSFRHVPNKLVGRNKTNKSLPDYISRHMDIDDVLGTSGQLFSPMMERLLARKTGQVLVDGDSSECEEIDPTQVRIHDSTPQHPVIQKARSRSDIIDCLDEGDKVEISAEEEPSAELKMTRQEMTCRVRFVNDTDPFRCWSEVTVPGKAVLHTFSTLLPLTCQLPALHRLLGAPQKLDDSALQVYKDGDYGPYLDLESSLSEQQEELEGFLDNRKNSIVLRTQLTVRVNGIIEKLLNSEGRELRRALFSLKQIFQEDKDLVHEFVLNDGLDCLIRVGAGADQNYQNYILRALGQVMLYVDGMNGVMKHSPSLQWLYTLIASDYRLVVKTTLKLLLVFVEYVDTNSILLIQAINAVDTSQGLPLWSNIINLLKDFEASDTELLIYAMTLINKCLSGITDQETYYQQTDSLKEQGIYDIIKRYISYQTIDLDLKRQLQIYEASMNHQIIDQRDKSIRKDDDVRKQSEDLNSEIKVIRPTKSHSLHLVNGTNNYTPASKYNDASTNSEDSKSTQSPLRSSSDVFRENIAASLQRRRERMQRQRELMKEQQTLASLALKKNCISLEENDVLNEENMIENHMLFLKKQGNVKDIAGKLSTATPAKVTAEENMAGIISKAIKGLSNCQIKESRSTTDVKTEVKRNNEIEWLNIAKALNRPLIFNSYDFSDLTEDEDDELPSGMEESIIPPPPPLFSMPTFNANIPPPPMCPSTPVPDSTVSVPIQAKTKKTIKLFWREIPQGTKIPTGTIWDELGKVKVDEASLEVLFETRTKEIIKKQLEANKNREVIVLDHKRSNAINILLKKLPPTQSIKNAIVNMDSSVLTREGIDKLLAMLPTKDEVIKIQEVQAINPSTPLGKAEQFLLTLSSIYELNARLKLWAFKLDFECFQNEILEAYIDMKQAIEVLKVNVTFKKILACILSIGVFLNGSEAKGFQIEYLSKIQEVKDTVHKHSLLHHLCQMVLDQFPDTSDLYSEIGAVTRGSKINYEELSSNIDRLETECKNHMGNFKIILKHDSTAIKTKVGDFLHDCAERIIILGLIKRRLFYRYSKFLVWLGVPPHHISETRPSDVFKIISEFALEYRTTRQQLQQQRQRKASHRERSKTRGKMITELNQIHLNESAENELTNILNTENFGKCTTNPLGRKRKDPGFIRIEKIDRSVNQEDGIEEVFNILLEKSRTRKKERPSKNSQKLQNRSKNPVHHQAIALFSHFTGHLQIPDP